MFVKLPSSFSNWPDTKEKLESLIGNSTWKNFEEFLLDFIKQSNRRNSICEDENPFPLLKNLLREDPTFLTNVLPKVCRLALEMPILFPEGKLKILDKNSEDVLELTRKKVIENKLKIDFINSNQAVNKSEESFVRKLKVWPLFYFYLNVLLSFDQNNYYCNFRSDVFYRTCFCALSCRTRT